MEWRGGKKTLMRMEEQEVGVLDGTREVRGDGCDERISDRGLSNTNVSGWMMLSPGERVERE